MNNIFICILTHLTAPAGCFLEGVQAGLREVGLCDQLRAYDHCLSEEFGCAGMWVEVLCYVYVVLEQGK